MRPPSTPSLPRIRIAPRIRARVVCLTQLSESVTMNQNETHTAMSGNSRIAERSRERGPTVGGLAAGSIANPPASCRRRAVTGSAR
jgi:hypothetical protein